MLRTQDLGGAWTLRVDPEGPSDLSPQAEALVGQDIPATVPGAVHADLLEAGLILDPNLDANELVVAWVGRADWILTRTLPPFVDDAERTDLVFDGVDTVARIELDGREVGATRNMHRRYRFDVTETARSASSLALHFTSAYTEAERVEAALGTRPNSYYPEPFNFLRKMACSFGWDWGLTLVTAGVWRGARLESWSTARIAELRPLTDFDGTTGTLSLHVEIERTERGRDHDIDLVVRIADIETVVRVKTGRGDVVVDIEVDGAVPWNPRGYGDPHLYALDVTLRDGDDILDSRSTRVGFRRIELDRSPDASGTRFTFAINGTPVFIKGVNWIPESVLPGTLSRSDYARRLAQARDANVNFVRVWGGGIYESDDFYDICDEQGILVWQDFLFSCAAYPEEEPIRSEVLAEARDNVSRLAGHPSLILWNGNNENLWLHEEKNWADMEGGTLTWGERYYREWLPEIVAELDPSRPYSAGSPWSGSWVHHPNDPDHETMHSWEVWNEVDYVDYRTTRPRFMAEFGWQSPPAWRTLRDAISDDPLAPDSPGVLHHQKAEDGNGKLARGIARHLPEPASFDAWHYLAQLTQVEAVTTGIRHWRSSWPHTAGAVVWQLNDLWPVTSWAAIDGAGRLKPLYFALRDTFADRILTIEPHQDDLVLHVVNDTDHDWDATVTLTRIDTSGRILAEQITSTTVPLRSVGAVALTPALTAFGPSRGELIVADAGGRRAYWWDADPKDLPLAQTNETIDVMSVADGLEITVVAREVLRGVLVQPDRIHPEATVDRGFQTLLPGESATFRVHCPDVLSAESVHAPYVVTHLDAVLRENEPPPGS
ncbi:glycosyl hydrolase 2 galactose-binding domain-containing protein [Microbacterium sp. SLBN-146]|uniref:glycoside hydrolase family 2 protein n=1 Tax=Microbacterium sp. SLBN-146 TaxID=2768457 RepID=UPI00115097B0|nr:glycoside hydrolase family 2 TIM barrel-domain containing protein [Microbacterium sp. SLBN-146]TQJ30449.1 beta-mannosidase [Microbacterium sp. SLBN-146]